MTKLGAVLIDKVVSVYVSAISVAAAAVLIRTAFIYGGVLSEYVAIHSASLTYVGVCALPLIATSSVRKCMKVSLVLAMLLVVLLLCQIVPLPLSVISTVSPVRYEHLLLVQGFGLDVSFAPLTEDVLKTTTMLQVWMGSMCVCMFVGCTIALKRKYMWLFVVVLMLVASLEACLGWIQANPFSLDTAQSIARGTLINRNHFACLLSIILPFHLGAAVYVWKSNSIPRNMNAIRVIVCTTCLASAAVIVSAIVLSRSRMGFIAALVSVSVFVVLWLKLGRRGTGEHTVHRGWASRLAAVVGVLVSSAAIVSAPLLYRVTSVVDAIDLSTDTRVSIWKSTLEICPQYLLTGAGLGAFETVYRQYNDVVPTKTIDYAHNDYIQLLLELGLPAMLVLMFLVGGIVYCAVNYLSVESEVREKVIVAACLASLSALSAHSLVEFNLYIPLIVLTAAWILGIVLGIVAGSNDAHVK
jgi:O-antigen ligase